MWSRGVKLEPERVAAWWTAMEPFVADIRLILAANGVLGEVQEERQTLKPASVTQVASLFGVDESIGTAAYTMLEGDTQGLLMLTSKMPATKAIDVASEVFRAFARGVGGQFEEPWALMDMRSTLASSLAAQTGCLELAVMATIEWSETALVFIPNWALWGARMQMELHEEAA